MKKKLVLMALLGYSTAFGSQGLFGSEFQYRDAVLITTVGAVLYAFNNCNSLKTFGDLLKQYVSLTIAGGAGLAVLYSNQFNNMIPQRLRINEFCDGLNTVLPYWFAVIIAGATYSNFCDRYDSWYISLFGVEKKQDTKQPTVTVDINT